LIRRTYPKMRWTHKRPTDVGKYWFRKDGNLIRCIVNIWKIRDGDGTLYTDYDGGAPLMDPHFDNSLWSNRPIPVPED